MAFVNDELTIVSHDVIDLAVSNQALDQSHINHALIHCKGTVVRVEDLPPEVRNPEPAATYVHFKRQDERTRMVGALQQTGGNRSEAARLLGMSRRTFYRRLAEYDVSALGDGGDAPLQ